MGVRHCSVLQNERATVLRGQHVLERLWTQPSGEQEAVGKSRSSEQALQPAVWLVGSWVGAGLKEVEGCTVWELGRDMGEQWPQTEGTGCSSPIAWQREMGLGSDDQSLSKRNQ